MDTEIAQALLKLAEVHDRRFGEIGTALGRLADQLTITDPIKEPARMVLADELKVGMSEIAGSIQNIAEAMPFEESE